MCRFLYILHTFGRFLPSLNFKREKKKFLIVIPLKKDLYLPYIHPVCINNILMCNLHVIKNCFCCLVPFNKEYVLEEKSTKKVFIQN